MMTSGKESVGYSRIRFSGISIPTAARTAYFLVYGDGSRTLSRPGLPESSVFLLIREIDLIVDDDGKQVGKKGETYGCRARGDQGKPAPKFHG